ncbi:MAG TPA: hypothetical protein VIP70_05175 [Nitrososphaeraceae archaeon]
MHTRRRDIIASLAQPISNVRRDYCAFDVGFAIGGPSRYILHLNLGVLLLDLSF